MTGAGGSGAGADAAELLERELLERELLADHARRRVGAAALAREAAPAAEHTADPGAEAVVQRSSPVCGDRVSVRLRARPDGRVELHWDGRGCTISQASASMLAEAAREASGAPALDAASLRMLLGAFRAMMTGSAEGIAPLGDALVLAGLRRVPGRIGCASLAWEAAAAALDQLEAGAAGAAGAEPPEAGASA